MTRKTATHGSPMIESRIFTVRGQRVIIDYDLAEVYGVSTRRLNEQVKRNIRRFPEDFAFQLTLREIENLRSQIAISSVIPNRSQIATGSQKHRDPRHSPYVFTEHGAIMAANVLRSERAVRMSVFVVRAFVKMRALLSAREEMAGKLAELEKALTKRLDLHDRVISDIVRQIALLLDPPSDESETTREKIGFRVRDVGAPYRKRSGKRRRMHD